MRIELTVADLTGRPRDVELRAPDGATFGDVRGALAHAVGLPQPTAMWSGADKLPPDARLGGPLLRSGAALGPRPGDVPDRVTAARLDVVGGPSAGRAVHAVPGSLVIGRAEGCALRIDDPDVSRQHALVTVSRSGAVLRDLASTNGTTVGGAPVPAAGAPLGPGRLVRLGSSFLTYTPGHGPSAALRETCDGTVLVNRAPRAPAGRLERCVALPATPSGPLGYRVPWLAALVPALLGGALAWAMHNVQFLLFAALSPLALLVTGIADRVRDGRSRRRIRADFRRADGVARALLASQVADEIAARHHADPDPADLCRIAITPQPRLWERTRGDPGLLRVRLGLGSAPSTVHAARDGTEIPAATLHAVPLGADLGAGPVGIAAPRPMALAIARWVVTQLATLVSPGDLELALLLSDDAAPAWRWVRWLPHLGPRVATTAAERRALVGELIAAADIAGGRPNDAVPGRRLVLVVDRCSELGDVPGLGRLLEAPGGAVTALCVDERERRLPAGCRTVVAASGETGAEVSMRLADGSRRTLVADRPDAVLTEQVARALAPLVDAAGDPVSALPTEVRLTDLLGLADPTAGDIAARWALDDGTATAVLGTGVTGDVVLDLDRDGPHALVAGTTGAGKSELLQSLVVGLAASYPPESVSFLLVDYKGGAAFADCARLPHTVGLVTDLADHLTRRALASLDGELRRREALFAAAGAKDLPAYRVARVGRAPARLMIVVDEFATLAEELPDFVSGLVAVAQRGRSLGVHLVLATQRPGGAVSPEIRANTALRVALRMTGAAESGEVLDGPEAASIDRRLPGRAYVRAGTTTTPVQVARVGCPVRRAGEAISVALLDEWRRPPVAALRDNERTDLQAITDAIAAAAERGHVRAPSPWLPPLPELLPADRLSDRTATAASPDELVVTPSGDSAGTAEDRDGRSAASSKDSADIAATVPIGLIDLPAHRAQPLFTVDLAGCGSLLLVGAPRSGRTSGLVSLAVAAARRLAPTDLHVHLLDFGGRGLSPLAGLPHCGTQATADDGFALAADLIARLEREVTRRRAELAALGLGTVAEARWLGAPIPLLLVLLDGWEGFAASSDDHDAGRSVQRLLGLLRDAPACGITVALAGDRGALAPRVVAATTLRLLLRLAERSDYAMAGLAPRDVPQHMPPGRAMRADDGAAVQLAFPGVTPDRAGQTRVVADCAARWHATTASNAPGLRIHNSGAGWAPIRLLCLPTRARLADLPATSGRLRLGVGGDEAAPIAIDPFAGAGRLLVAGPARSGRSTALRVLLREALELGITTAVAAPGRSPLHRLATSLGISVIVPSDPAPDLPCAQRVLLLVDDCEMFTDTAAGDLLCDWLRDSGAAAVVAGRSEEVAVAFRGLACEVRRARCALLLAPGPVDGELVGIRLPRSRGADPPGRGVLVADPAWAITDSGVLPIQIADPEPEEA